MTILTIPRRLGAHRALDNFPKRAHTDIVKLGPGLSFSWKRALGVTKAKRSIARSTGMPTTRGGRRAKFGRMFGIK